VGRDHPQDLRPGIGSNGLPALEKRAWPDAPDLFRGRICLRVRVSSIRISIGSPMSDRHLIETFENGIATLVMNRPEARKRWRYEDLRRRCARRARIATSICSQRSAARRGRPFEASEAQALSAEAKAAERRLEDVLQHGLVQRQIRHQPLQLGVLLLQSAGGSPPRPCRRTASSTGRTSPPRPRACGRPPPLTSRFLSAAGRRRSARPRTVCVSWHPPSWIRMPEKFSSLADQFPGSGPAVVSLEEGIT
jgi:hypothetical protein